MPRIHGVREKRDHTIYDTHFLEAGQSVWFFRDADVGNQFRTNLQVVGQFASDSTYYLLAIGTRLIGKTRAEEDRLLDYLKFTLIFGDMPQHEILGPQASMLTHVFSGEELKKLKAQRRDDAPTERRVGYHFAPPLVLPVRQCFEVRAEASPMLPEACVVRVHLFGLQTRDVC